MDHQENLAVIERPAMPVMPIMKQDGFTIEDIVWATGIWSVLLTMSPVIFFYVLMVG